MKLEQVTQIFNGWANLALDQFNLLDPEFKKVAEQRLLICNSCPLREGNKCDSSKQGIVKENFTYKSTGQIRVKGDTFNGCGCQLAAKTVCRECQCPGAYWLEYKEDDNRDSKNS